MTTPTTAAALLARGKPIQLADGTTRHLRYDFLAMYHIEASYGSIGALMDEAQKMNDDGMRAAFLGLTLDLVRFGWTTPEGAGLDTPPSRQEVARVLDLARASEYATAAMEAVDEAFGPTLPPKASEGPGDPTRGSSGSSTGPSEPDTTSSAGSGI